MGPRIKRHHRDRENHFPEECGRYLQKKENINKDLEKSYSHYFKYAYILE